GAAAVLALGDDALERGVLEGMVLDLYGEALLRGVEARALGDRPREQDAVELEAEVVVQARGGVLLDDEEVAARGALHLAGRLARLLEVPLPVVLLERHADGEISGFRQRRRGFAAPAHLARVGHRGRGGMAKPSPRVNKSGQDASDSNS